MSAQIAGAGLDQIAVCLSGSPASRVVRRGSGCGGAAASSGRGPMSARPASASGAAANACPCARTTTTCHFRDTDGVRLGL